MLLFQVDPLRTELQAISLLTFDTLTENVEYMHYCDLISPYRALEWVYITSVVHGEE